MGQGIYPDLPVLMISGHGTIETAVQAIRQGAYDFIEKPFKEGRLLLMVERALQARLARENAELRARVPEENEPEIIGQSHAVKALHTAIERIAPTASRVLINGPNGSGKELAARLIHYKSQRRDARFVVANCARLAPEKVDAELFGSESLQSNRRIVGLLNRPTKEHYISMKFVICRLKPRARLFAPSLNSDFAGSVAMSKSRSMSSDLCVKPRSHHQNKERGAS